MRILILLIINILLITFQANGCALDGSYSITERSLMSAELVEGKVIAKESIWLENEARIVTIHTIQINKNFKKSKDGVLQIVTNGGLIGDEWHHSAAELELNLGNEGIFFLGDTKNFKGNNGVNIQGNYAHFGKTSFVSVLGNTNEEKAAIYKKLPNPLFSNAKNENNEQKTNAGAAMNISCIFPDVLTAGNNDTLTIQGNGFGTYLENESIIFFRNADTGGNSFIQAPIESYVSWSDTEIVMTVPPRAGSGDIRIQNKYGQSIASAADIMVSYALKGSNKDQKPTYLIGKNDLGGYTFTLTTSFKNSAAEPAFMRIIEKFRTEIGFNITVDAVNTTDIAIPSNDGVDVIGFDSNDFPINALAIAYSQFRRCGNGWEVAGMDVFFKSEINGSNWYVEEDAPSSGDLDFESVATHEILHTFQLNHNNETESVMYYTYAYGSNKRNLNPCFDLKATKDINERSLAYTPTCSGHSAYQALESYEMLDLSNIACPKGNASCLENSFKAKVFLQGFCTEESAMMSSDFAINGLLPSQQPFNKAPWFYEGTETFSYTQVLLNEVVDWVLIDFYEEENPTEIVASKAGILRNDGMIIQADGNTNFALEGLDTNKKYFFAINQANHLLIKSAEAVSLSDGELYDFTTTAEKTLGGAVKEMSNGSCAMYAGDFDANGIINNIDYNEWANNSAAVDVYSAVDVDGNGIINNKDYNEWAKNKSKVSPAAYID